jgi:glutathione S-transferase
VDEDGYFFMVDRLKRMINASGFKVWPAEVEALLYQHPAIQEACVIGASDPRRGETVKAVVVLKPGLRGQVSEQEIVDWAHATWRPTRCRASSVRRRLPKSGTGKVMWRSCRMKLVFVTIPRQPMPFFVRPIARKLCATVQAKLIDPNLKSAMEFIESHLAKNSWFAGERLTLADFQMSFAVAALLSRGNASDTCPHIVAWLKRVEARPAWQRGIAKGGPLLMAA